MTNLEILRAALRDYQEAATDALCAYRPGEPNGGAAFGRFLALDRSAGEIREIVAAVSRGEHPDRTAADIVTSRLADAFIHPSVVQVVRDDLLLRLCGEPSQIPECLR